MTLGLDIGTTSVSGVAVDAEGRVLATVTRPHTADLPKRGEGIDEQDAERFLLTAQAVRAEIEQVAGRAERVGWTGQMHGVVAVDEAFRPLTPFVTWRDERRYGGRVMEGWQNEGLNAHKCLTAPGFVLARTEGRLLIDPTFLESWHIGEGSVPAEWLPENVEGVLLGDNQAGVFAAQRICPGCAVINVGTSGQLSIVTEASRTGTAALPGIEERLYPGGRRLLCRASHVGGQALSRLRVQLGLTWEELNERAERDEHIASCLSAIVDDLCVGLDLSGVTGLVGVGNALRLNPSLRRAVERRFDLKCLVPVVTEMAAYGAALYACESTRERVPE